MVKSFENKVLLKTSGYGIRKIIIKNSGTQVGYYYKVINGKKYRITGDKWHKLTGFRPILTYRRAKPNEWTSQKKINQIIKKYPNKKALLLCHGKKHRSILNYNVPTKQKIPLLSKAITLDINPYSEPDIIGNIDNKSFMDRLPKKYFNRISKMYCASIGNPIKRKSVYLWKTISNLLQDGGKYIDEETFSSYHRKKIKINPNITEKTLKLELESYFLQFFSKVIFGKTLVIRYKHPPKDEKIIRSLIILIK